MTAASKRPNVLVIQPDQHRGITLGCAGDEQARTPNLDRLAASGIRFSHAVSSSPVCSPFRGSMQTGLYCHTHGVITNNLRLNPALTGFAEVFSGAGYATGYIGKWHLDGGIPKEEVGGYVPAGPRRHGWQEWNGYEKSHEYLKVWRYDAREKKVPVPGYHWEPTWHTDMALDFARRHGAEGRPWLYYIAFGPPHPPEECLQEFEDLFPPDKFRLPPDLTALIKEGREKELRSLWQIYYGLVNAIDREVGRLVEGLRQQGQLDNTIILYTSDHGDRLGSHTGPDGKLRGKGAPYANAYRIPLIVHWPEGARRRVVSDTLVSSVDLAPTILDLAGLPVPHQMQGQSMAAWCTSGKGPQRDAVYLGLGDVRGGWRAVWDGRSIYSRGKYDVLYDYQKDPYEMDNLVKDTKLSAVRNRKLLELAEETRDPALPALRAGTFGL